MRRRRSKLVGGGLATTIRGTKRADSVAVMYARFSSILKPYILPIRCIKLLSNTQWNVFGMDEKSTLALWPLFTRIGLGLALFTLTASPPCSASDYELEVIKSKRVLLVKKGPKVERRFFISTGRGGTGGKSRRGDHKTPLGKYRIVDFNENSQFYFFMQLDYPSIRDAFWGLKNRLISRRDFDRIVLAHRLHEIPPQQTALGGLIGIHGLGSMTAERLRIHDSLDWTQGCIALTNEEINELRRYVDVGTPVLITE
jgi:L,D-transpeptidase catalytic domain